MKNKILSLTLPIIVVLSFGFVTPAHAATASKGITVVAPNGGEVYTEGQTATIRWSATGKSVSNIYIGYSTGPGSLNWIATGLTNTGSYNWLVNVGQTTNTQFKIYISATIDRSTYTDYSNNFFTVYQRVPTLTFTAGTTTLPYNNTGTTLTWSSTNMTSCTASGAWTGSKTTSGTFATGALTSSRSYALDCSSIWGSAQKIIAITVAPAPIPTVNLTADSTNLPNGGATTLHWTTANATSCTASNAWSGSQPLSGSYSTGALTSSRTYTLICSGVGGQGIGSVTINVAAPLPVVSISADSTNLAYNGATTIRWSSSGVTSCTSSWAGLVATSGSYATGQLTSTRDYSITCTGAGGSAQSTVTVNVAPSTLPLPSITFTADNYTILPNTSTTLHWSVTDAVSCSANWGWSGNIGFGGSTTTGSLSSDKLYEVFCYNADSYYTYRRVDVNVRNVVNPVVFSGTVQNALDSGRSLDCTSPSFEEGKGPSADRYHYYFGPGAIRRQLEAAGGTGTYNSWVNDIIVPGTAMYEFGPSLPLTTYLPGSTYYENAIADDATRSLATYNCNEAPIDPALFVPPAN